MTSTRLSAAEIAALDPYTFMAVIGERVIHPADRADISTGAGLDDIETETAACAESASTQAHVVGAHR